MPSDKLGVLGWGETPFLLGPWPWSLQCHVQLETIHTLTPWDIPWLQFLTLSRGFLLITETTVEKEENSQYLEKTMGILIYLGRQ